MNGIIHMMIQLGVRISTVSGKLMTVAFFVLAGSVVARAQDDPVDESGAVTVEAVVPVDAPSPHELVRDGNRLLEGGDHAGALKAYLAAQDQRPDALQISFDKGLSYLRMKDFDSAREEFDRASLADDLSLADDAVFGLGACDHSEALEGGDDPKQAIGKLENAMRHYQDILSGNPAHSAAREANYKAAMTWRQLKEMQQQQEQQNQNQDQSQDGDQQQDQQQNQQQSDKGEQDQDDQQQEQQQNQQQQEQEQQQQGEQSDEQQDQQQQAQEQTGESRQQATRQLRQLMDRVRQRKQDRVEYVPARAAPARKDW